MDTSKHYLTKEKLEELKTELDFLKKKKRKEIAKKAAEKRWAKK